MMEMGFDALVWESLVTGLGGDADLGVKTREDALAREREAERSQDRL